MWTYLIIFISALVLLLVFVRRFVLFLRKITNDKDSQNMAKEDGENKEVQTDIKPEKKGKNSEVEALCKRGEVLLQAGKDDDAIKCFVQALALDNLHLETQHKLAMLYLQKQLFGAASALFKQLADLTQDPVHYSHLGLALYQQNDFKEAKEAYQKAITLDSTRPQRFVSLSQVYRSLGEVHNAIVALNKAIEMDENNTDFLILLATLQMELGNAVEAKEILNKILIVDPKNKEAKTLLKEAEAF